MRIADATFVVVDTETTGGRAAGDRLLEIGAVVVECGRITRRFDELINPECAVPRRITALTGISTAMVFDRPTAEAVLPQFCDFLGDGVLVAHNLGFDVGFLNRACVRAGRPELVNDTLCTLRLARRLLPGLRSKRLSSIADFYGIRIRRHHRALADAEATAEILLRFLDQLDLEFGIDRVADVLSFQYRRYSEVRRSSSHVARIRSEVLDALPEVPGVYFMKDGRGKVIYVGKAQNLSSRVRSYFTAVEGHPHRIRQMVKAVRDIEWEETDSELDALVLESRMIKELQPTHNRALLRYVNRPFIRIGTEHAFPRISSSAFLHHDGAEYYGPLSDRDEAAFLVGLIDQFFRLRECDDELFARGRKCVYASIGRCTAPCEAAKDFAAHSETAANSPAHGEAAADPIPPDKEGADATAPGDAMSTSRSARRAYGRELDRVRAFLAGEDDGVVEQLAEAMKAAAADLDYEQAGVYRDWRAKLQRILEKRGAVATCVLEHNAVVIHQKEDQPPRLLVICRGRHVDTLIADGDERADVCAALEQRMTAHFEAPPPTEVYREREIDEIYVLSHWLYVHRSETVQVQLRDGESAALLAHRVAALLHPPRETLALERPADGAEEAPPGGWLPGTLGDGAVLTEGQFPRQI